MAAAPLNKKSNILFLVPTLRRAGAEIQVVDLVNTLDNAKFSKSLVVFNGNIDNVDRLDQENVALYEFSRANKLDFSAARKIAEIIDRNNIDVIHCTLQISLLVGWLARILAQGKPMIVVAIHSTLNISRYVEFFDRFLYRFLIRYCEKVIFVCQNQADFWKNRFRELEKKSVVIHNGVDADFFEPGSFRTAAENLRTSLGIPSASAVVICVAGFRKVKNHGVLVDALSNLTCEPYLLLAGDGALRSDIESRVRAKGLAERVRFLGDMVDVRPALAAADVFVLASATENFSMAMLESMAMEVPTIVTDVGGSSEAVVPGETGMLMAVGDVAALGEALRECLENLTRAKSMGKNARSRVMTRFSKQAMVDKTEALLADLLVGHSP